MSVGGKGHTGTHPFGEEVAFLSTEIPEVHEGFCREVGVI
jgi:hypothetical protein